MSEYNWQAWNPGLDNDGKTLQEVYDSIPELPPEDFRLINQLIDRPTILTENLSMFEQDCLHIILGRGLLAQDEAFVIGYTMGSANTLKDWEAGIFRLVAKLCYPGTYQFTDDDVKAFKLGVELGGKSTFREIHKYNFTKQFDKTLGEIREELDIDKDRLRDFYRVEQKIIPSSPVSKRLAV